MVETTDLEYIADARQYYAVSVKPYSQEVETHRGDDKGDTKWRFQLLKLTFAVNERRDRLLNYHNGLEFVAIAAEIFESLREKRDILDETVRGFEAYLAQTELAVKSGNTFVDELPKFGEDR